MQAGAGCGARPKGLPRCRSLCLFFLFALWKRAGEVTITRARMLLPGNKTKCAVRLGGVGLKEAEEVRDTIGTVGLWRAFFCGVSLFFGCLLVPASGAETGRSPAEQERRALEIRLAISRLPEERLEERESLYYEIVNSCPETEAAEEALWALSSLYLDAFPEPREQQAREVLERFLAHYPDSGWGLQVRSRLILLCAGTENRGRAAELCRELLGPRAAELPESHRPFLALTEAVAWDEAGEAKKAREAYAGVVREYPGTPQAEHAGRRLAAMNAGKTRK